MSEINSMLETAFHQLRASYEREGKIEMHDAWNEVTMGAAVNGLGHAIARFLVDSAKRGDDWEGARVDMAHLVMKLVYGLG